MRSKVGTRARSMVPATNLKRKLRIGVWLSVAAMALAFRAPVVRFRKSTIYE